MTNGAPHFSSLPFLSILIVSIALIVPHAHANPIRAPERTGDWVPIASKCIEIAGQRVCIGSGGGGRGDGWQKRGGGGWGGGGKNWPSEGKKPKKKRGSGDQANPGERSCPPGYVVLGKPNKYGAFCEPVGSNKAPQPTQAQKCKFGMIGTPPDCRCPTGSVFQGYKGCVPLLLGKHRPPQKSDPNPLCPACSPEGGIPPPKKAYRK